MKKITLFFTMLCLTALSFGQIVNIPDANFKNALLNHVPVIDTDNDGEIQESEAAAFTGAMDVSNKNISDLTGIEAFTALTGLNCNINQLTTLDLHNNPALTSLNCDNNQLTILDLNHNPALTELNVSHNELTFVGVGNNTALVELNVSHNELTDIDINYNTALVKLDASYNQLAYLILNTNTALKELRCGSNLLSQDQSLIDKIDLADNLNLEILDLTNDPAHIYHNNLFTIDVSNNGMLNTLRLGLTKLKTLDVSQNPALTELVVDQNELTGLNIANGNNANITVFDSTNNPYLTCVQVDAGIVGSIPSSWNYDAGTQFSDDCILHIPDANFKNALLNHTPVIDTNNDGEIQVSEAAAFAGTMDVSGKSISDLTGIEAFTTLTVLGCGENQLTSIDVSNNTALTSLNVYNNQITYVDVSQNPALIELGVNYNQLTNLDVSNNSSLKVLWCGSNQLTHIDVSNNPALEVFELGGNQIDFLDVSQNPVLVQLSADQTQLTSLNIANGNNANITYFDITDNPGLTCVQVDAGIVGSIPSSWQYDAGVMFSDDCILHIPDPGFRDALLNHDPVIDIDGDGIILNSEARDFTGVINVSDGGSGFRSTITDLTGIKAFTNAAGLWAYGNGLTSVDLRNNASFTEIRLEDNQLKNLSIANGNNANLTVLNITNNPDLTCVEVDEDMVGNIPAGWQYDAGVSFNATCALATEEFTTARVVMYPNPANGVVTIQSQSEIKNITVFDLHGKQAISQSGNTFDVSALKSGIYLVRIVAENSVSVQKLVVK